MLTSKEGAGPGYDGTDLAFELAPAPPGNASNSAWLATVDEPTVTNSTRGYLLVPGSNGKLGSLCASPDDGSSHAAAVVCRALGWTGGARVAAAAPDPTTAARLVAWEALRCNGSEASPLECNHTAAEEGAALSTCKSGLLMIECAEDPGALALHGMLAAAGRPFLAGSR